MCLIPNDSARIAQKDIIVYKILLKSSEGFYLSPYRDEPYYMGELKTANIRYRLRTREGLHFPVRKWIIEEGLHAFIDYSTASLTAVMTPISGLSIVKGVIPKGAMYVLGTGNEIVSTQLKLIEECH